MNQSRILYLFTRTPLHVGAGASVGAIDQPVQRERHTGFPIIPASSLKGTFADAWNDELLEELNDKREAKKVRVKEDGTSSSVAWLFGSDSDKYAAAGALQFSEAKLLAFPIRSAKGSFAWITCPLMLARADRDKVPGVSELSTTLSKALEAKDGDSLAIFAAGGPLALTVKDGGHEKTQVVLEEYTFTHAAEPPEGLGAALNALLAQDDPVWSEVASRLVILSNGMMSFFAQNACEVAQHVRISDKTGTAERGALFNQENVPSESLFYSVVHAFDERTATKAKERRKAAAALAAFEKNVACRKVFQFGGDASTGLGYCTVKLNSEKGA